MLKRNDEALAAFDKAIEIRSDLAQAWLYRGNVLTELNNYDRAFFDFSRALELEPDLAEAWFGLGSLHAESKRLDQAIAAYDKALALKADLAEAWLGRGNLLIALKRYDDASANFNNALTYKPDLAGAWVGCGNLFLLLRRYDEAFAAYDKALELDPGLAEAWLGRGNACLLLRRYDDAVEAHNTAMALEPELAGAWLGRGNIYSNLKRHDEAFAAYDKALALDPGLANALIGRGNLLVELKRYDDALAAYDKALALEPELSDAWLGRGNVYSGLKRHDEAFAAYGKALALDPRSAEAWLGRGHLLVELKRYDEASAAYDEAFTLRSDLIGLEGARLNAKMQICDWRSLDTERENLMASVTSGKENTPPFTFLAISTSAEEQSKYARLWCAKSLPASNKPIWTGEIYKHDRIHVAYVSADFHQHATSYLMAGMFECHDKSRFEVTAISIGPHDNSEMRRRLIGSFDRFVDVRTLSDDEIASQIGKLEIDLLIDLKGFTQDARTGIFARRPAPIQINYLGYPGTMGAECIDYLVADQTLIPESFQSCYTEKIVYLPNSYQVNDTKRLISNRVFTRAEFGLPRKGFVFCCFNGNYKITPEVFDCWMQILVQVEGSVLWLLEGDGSAAANLRRESTARGVSADRLIFAKRAPSADHLGRHRLADLFLDTLPYNAHTTASDALWAGLPVLTQIGETFAGRVAASLLNAIGLPELITQTQDQYMNAAVELASNPEKLASVKARLAQNQLTKPLFDTQLFTRHIENAYEAMYDRHQQGLPFDHIYVQQ
jgi:protein O-GlcNAc transferase